MMDPTCKYYHSCGYEHCRSRKCDEYEQVQGQAYFGEDASPIDPTLVRPVAEQVAETARINERLQTEVTRLQLLLDTATGQLQ